MKSHNKAIKFAPYGRWTLASSRRFGSVRNYKEVSRVRIALIGLLLVSLSGCTFMHQDFANYGKIYKKIPLHMLSIGDDKQQVVTKIGEPVNVIGSKKFENGTIEVWAYEKWYARVGYDEKEEEYWLYFLDGQLEQWGRPGDWSREADRIYEIRHR